MTDRMRPAVRSAALLAAVAAIGVVLAEVLLSPNGSQRADLVTVLVVPAAIAAAVLPLVRHWIGRCRRIIGVLGVATGAAIVLGVAASAAATRAMFVSSHDFRLFLVVLTVSVGLGAVVGQDLIRPIIADIGRLRRGLHRLSDGHSDVRTNISRNDEIGETAAAFQRLVTRLAAAEREREALAVARRTMLASVSHDIRTPLTAARAATEAVRDGVAPDPDTYLRLVEQHLTTCEHLLAQLSDLARLESAPTALAAEAVSVAELVDEAVESLAPLAARHDVTIETRADGAGVVYGEPSDLSRVIRNLLDNGIRHCRAGGRVVATVNAGQQVVVQVTDEGHGFPAEFRAIAFEPFTQADEARTRVGRSGLGLAICRAIIERHGGSIRLGPGPGGDVIVELDAFRKLAPT